MIISSGPVVAAHAEVHGTAGSGFGAETAWANGTGFGGNSWAMYTDYCIQDCAPECEFPTETFDIIGGQTVNEGYLEVTNNSDSLYVTYNFTGGWEADVTHLYVGDLAGLPTNNANTPIPGQFPLKTEHFRVGGASITTYTYVIPLSELPSCYIIAAHASTTLYNEDGEEEYSNTSWSYGTEFPNTNRWGWYSNYCTGGCEPPAST